MGSLNDVPDCPATRKSTAVLRFVEGSGPRQLDELKTKFQEHWDRGIRTFLVDLDGVSYVNSTALALLVRLRKEADSLNADFQLINVAVTVHDILRTTRLHEYFFDDSAE